MLRTAIETQPSYLFECLLPNVLFSALIKYYNGFLSLCF